MNSILTKKKKDKIRMVIKRLQEHLDEVFKEAYMKHNMKQIQDIKRCMEDLNELRDLFV